MRGRSGKVALETAGESFHLGDVPQVGFRFIMVANISDVLTFKQKRARSFTRPEATKPAERRRGRRFKHTQKKAK